MVMISILYPNKKNAKFDLEYYINTHMPTSIERLSTHRGFRGVSVVQGIAGEMPDSAPAYVAAILASNNSKTHLEDVVNVGD